MKRPIPFGKYYLLERINVGGMAEVFKAKTYGVEGFERLLAVKRILPNIAEDEEFINMFIDEAKIAVELNHGNIAQIFDLGKVDGSFFIALEYISGRDLRAIFDRCKALGEAMPVPQACFMIMKVCEGLDYAHNKRDKSGMQMSLVHRDVSPQNVLISYEGEVKLVDFGIAKAAGKASKTQAGILKGKFGYMSPEQVRGLPLDRRSDIFSLGIVLYELLTGERLFTGESDFSTLEKVRNVEILPPSAYNRKIAEELEQIALKALSKDVEERYQNAIDLHDDLQAYMYSSGDFYSRKDLAGWMKQTFAREIEEESKKLEAYNQLPVPELRPTPPPVPPESMGASGEYGHAPLQDHHFEVRDPNSGNLESQNNPEDVPSLNWDEDEVETQIYDKPEAPGSTLELQPSKVAPRDTTPPLVEEDPPRRSQTVPPVEYEHGSQAVDLEPVTGQHSRSRTGIWITVALLTTLICGGAIYYVMEVARKKPGEIFIQAHPKDVDVYLDGKKQSGSKTPLTIRSLVPGGYIVALEKVGFERWTESVEVNPGETVRLEAKLERQAMATIELRTTPRGGKAYLDGHELTGVTPLRITQVTPSKHRIEVSKPPYQPWIHEFEIQPEQVLRLYAKLLPREVVVQIKSNPQGEAFLIRDDGQREVIGPTPATLPLNPKYSYKVEVKAEGYQTWVQPSQFTGDEPVRLEAVLKRINARTLPKERITPKPTPRPRPYPKPKPKHDTVAVKPPQPKPKPKPKPTPPPVPRPLAMGTLLVNSNPWTKIFIDGRDTGLTTPQKRIPLPAGRHSITLKNAKFNVNQVIQVTIRPGQPTKVIRNFLK